MKKRNDEIVLDDLDFEIISFLKSDSRASFRKLSRKLGISPSTVIERVDRMLEFGVIKNFTIVVDMEKIGYRYFGFVKVYVDNKDMMETQQRISNLPGVLAVYDVTGEYDAIALIAAKTRTEFGNLVKKILKVKGVNRTNTSLILNSIKSFTDYIP